MDWARLIHVFERLSSKKIGPKKNGPIEPGPSNPRVRRAEPAGYTSNPCNLSTIFFLLIDLYLLCMVRGILRAFFPYKLSTTNLKSHMSKAQHCFVA